jgi:hypothetical protein
LSIAKKGSSVETSALRGFVSLSDGSLYGAFARTKGLLHRYDHERRRDPRGGGGFSDSSALSYCARRIRPALVLGLESAAPLDAHRFVFAAAQRSVHTAVTPFPFPRGGIPIDGVDVDVALEGEPVTVPFVPASAATATAAAPEIEATYIVPVLTAVV